MHTRNRKSMGIKVLNLLAAGLLVAALVLGCNTNVSNGGEVQPPTPPVTDGYTVTMSAGVNGSITANPVIPAGGKVAKDAEITFTATANPGYRVHTWTITGGTIQAGGQQGDTTAKVKVIADTTVNVTFKPIVYTPVAYADLPNHLTTAQPETNGIYYIEVTGLTAPDVKGNILSNSESPLGKILKKNKKKKVALKFGTMPYVTDMKKCFEGCTNLVQVSNIPDSITDMWRCFKGCTKLEQVPNIPDSVTNMSHCFYCCTSLTSVPNIPNSVTNMWSCFEGCTKLEQVPNIPNSVKDMIWCFVGCTSLTSVTLKCEYLDGKFNVAFSGCSSLSADSIKVPADSLDDYKDNANKMGAKAEWFAKDE